MAKKYSAPPPLTIDPKKKYTATFKTEKGDFVVELYADKAPQTVNNFVFLARDKFYDGVTFHRVIRDFMAQGGDPTGTGSGGPGYKFGDEFHPAGHQRQPVLHHAWADAPLGQQAHGLRQSDSRHGGRPLHPRPRSGPGDAAGNEDQLD